jgi:putative phosphoesterase
MQIDQGDILLIADTHIPDRVFDLHPQLVDWLNNHTVNLILHAGDVCTAGAIKHLEKYAPVVVATGNRDWFILNRSSAIQRLVVGGKRLALLHGHGTFWDYWRGKIEYYKDGYQLERYQRIFERLAADADVIVFGHTHHVEVVNWAGRLLINPGAACASPTAPAPSIGVLHVAADGEITPEIVYLTGYNIHNNRWEVNK